MKEEVNIADLKVIIQTLIKFIVVDGKSFVTEAKKEEYVASYVHLLVKMINQAEEEKNHSIVEKIASDIANYIK